MNTRTTSWPACLRSSAATDESTPPDRPTITLLGRDMEDLRSDSTARERCSAFAVNFLHGVERHQATLAEVVDAAKHQRTAMLVEARDDFVVTQPQRIDDVHVELALRLVRHDPRRIREANERRAVVGRLPAIDADQCIRLDTPCRFLQRLARSALRERFARLEMTRRLVEAQSATRA